MAGAAAGAGFGFALKRPAEWARTAGGYGRRFGSSLGQFAVKSAIQFGVGALRHEQQAYERAESGGVWPRTRHALVSTVWVRRSNREGKTVGAGRIAGSLGAGFISRLWQPTRLRTIGGGFASGGISLGADAGINVLREFWPDLRKRVRR